MDAPGTIPSPGLSPQGGYNNAPFLRTAILRGRHLKRAPKPLQCGIPPPGAEMLQTRLPATGALGAWGAIAEKPALAGVGHSPSPTRLVRKAKLFRYTLTASTRCQPKACLATWHPVGEASPTSQSTSTLCCFFLCCTSPRANPSPVDGFKWIGHLVLAGCCFNPPLTYAGAAHRGLHLHHVCPCGSCTQRLCPAPALYARSLPCFSMLLGKYACLSEAALSSTALPPSPMTGARTLITTT